MMGVHLYRIYFLSVGLIFRRWNLRYDVVPQNVWWRLHRITWNNAARVGGSFSDSVCFFLNNHHISLLVFLMCLWFIDLADKLLNCFKSAVSELGDCANRGQCYESETICSLNAFHKLCLPFSAKLPVLFLPLRASRAAVLLLSLVQVHHRLGWGGLFSDPFPQ